MHSNNDFVFVPEANASPNYPNVVFGWIAREKMLRERTPPSEGLEPTEHGSWQAAFAMIDVSPHDDGQKIAMEHNTAVGMPIAIWKSLLKSMNAATEAPYHGEVYPIVEEGSFWNFAQAHKNRIRSITLDVAAPNMFDDVNDFQNEMRSLRDKENVSRVKTTLESDTILNTTERLTQIVDYTERGAGTLSATSEDGSTYSSEKHDKHVNLPVEPHSKNQSEFLRQILTLLDRIF
ncbi:hypothetical protein ACVWW2_000894 [Bradyrhizobium sp. LM4.3]